MFKRLISTLLICFPISLLCCGFLDTTTSLNQKGNKNYNEKRYETALEAYRKAQIKNPDLPEVRYNLGTTLYQLDQFQEAETQLQQALANAKTNELKATAWYNFGNTQYRLGQFDKATESYKEALKLNPNDKDAKFNLELLQKKKALFQNKQNKREQDRKQNPPPSQQQKQQQQKGGGQDQKQQNKSQSPQNKQDQQQQDKNQKEGQQSQQDQEKGQKEEKPKDEGNQDKSENPEQDEQKKDESKKDQDKNEGQEPRNEPETPAQFQPDQEGPKPEQAGQTQAPLLQGQMSQENALRILNALKESEQGLQILRQPKQKQNEREPLKDW